MRINAVKRTIPSNLKDFIKNDQNIDHVFTTKDLFQSVKGSKFIVSCLPMTQETESILNKNVFSAMDPNSVLVNVGRGKNVNEDDLYEALKSGKLMGVAMDVSRDEPLPKDHWIYTDKNLKNKIIYTCH